MEPEVFGRYLLKEKIGQGGMAEIFLATSQGAHGFERRLVVKRILPEHAAEARFVEWFIDEARLMMRLEHPKIVQVFDFGDVDGQYYLAMEYVPGIDCLELLRTCARRHWRPSAIITVHIMADVLDALHYAHTLTDELGRPLNIVHCDVSPSNIFISELGEVKLSDFGIATMSTRRAAETDPGHVRGKYGYLAPEVVSGQPMDHRADIFSAGVVLAELLMVQRLFRGRNYLDVLLQVRDGNLERLERFGSHIDPELRQILGYALARDPYLRYPDAAAFRDALHRYLYERQQLLRSTSVRRFMKRILEPVAPPESPGAAAGGAAGEAPSPDQSYLHGKRHILLAPPPRPAPVPLGRERTEALARLSAGETVGVPLPDGTPGTAEAFAQTSSVPAPPPLPLVHETHRVRQPSESPGGIGHEMAAPFSPSAESQLERLTPDGQWDLTETSLVSILFQLALATETGLLVLRQGSSVKEIYLTDGDPQFVASNLRQELFGQFLLARGVLSDEELGRALAILPEYNGHLGEALVALRLLRPMQVLRLLTKQVRHKVISAFARPSGTVTYYRGVSCNRPAAPLGLDAFELLQAGVDALGNDAVAARIGAARSRRLQAVDQPPVPPEVFRVGGYPRQVYDQLQGRHSLETLLQSNPEEPTPGAFLRTVYLLVECGLAVFE